ncbi:hypothetical protein ACSFBF_07050 [Variovorax sp. ZT5P49]|uniref:hypothetical protein n=1 Tax=Variovorax sp. ZT5P49 TaxID=3443733 RepID=UPI003F478A66
MEATEQQAPAAQVNAIIATLRQSASDLANITRAAASAGAPIPPAPGEFWPEQGGVYAGVMRGAPGKAPYHLIVPTDPQADIKNVAWGGYGKEEPGAICEWDGLANTQALIASKISHPAAEASGGLVIDGHSDFYLPSRRELALCYATVPELFDKSEWHLSSTQASSYDAWTQYFDNGYQYDGLKKFEGRARLVRRLFLQSFGTSIEGGAA